MKKEERSLHDHHRIFKNLMFVGVVVMLSAVLFQHSHFFWIPWCAGFLIMIGSVVYRSKYCKCPHCGSNALPRGKLPRFCPECGEPLA